MSGVLEDIVDHAAAVIEALTPAAASVGRNPAYQRIRNWEDTVGGENDRAFYFDVGAAVFDETSTHASGGFSRLRMTMPLRLRVAGFGPSDTDAIGRMAHDVPQVINAINTEADWPANTVRVHCDDPPRHERTDRDLVSVIPLSIEYEEV